MSFKKSPVFNDVDISFVPVLLGGIIKVSKIPRHDIVFGLSGDT